MSYLVLVSITPIGKGESLSKYVAKFVKKVEESGLSYQLTPMGTVIEGNSWEEVFSTIKKGFEEVERECNRISLLIKLDYRKGREGAIKRKVESVREKLRDGL